MGYNGADSMYEINCDDVMYVMYVQITWFTTLYICLGTSSAFLRARAKHILNPNVLGMA